MTGIFKTISAPSAGRLTEKMSRFLAFAHPVADVEQVKKLIKEYTNKYHDARHVCWAYMLGAEREQYQSTDNGEPSGTAGRPILGQINSFGLTDILVIVVRYFGGIKLGPPGLIAAYRESARLALEEASVEEKTVMDTISIMFPYESMNGVMKLVKQCGVKVLAQEFDNLCRMTLEVPLTDSGSIKGRLLKVEGVLEE